MNLQNLKNRNQNFNNLSEAEKSIYVNEILKKTSLSNLRNYAENLNLLIKSEQIGYNTTERLKEHFRNPLTSEAVCLFLEHEFLTNIIDFYDCEATKLILNEFYTPEL